jgi:hypothetical protein
LSAHILLHCTVNSTLPLRLPPRLSTRFAYAPVIQPTPQDRLLICIPMLHFFAVLRLYQPAAMIRSKGFHSTSPLYIDDTPPRLKEIRSRKICRMHRHARTSCTFACRAKASSLSATGRLKGVVVGLSHAARKCVALNLFFLRGAFLIAKQSAMPGPLFYRSKSAGCMQGGWILPSSALSACRRLRFARPIRRPLMSFPLACDI